MEASGPAVFSLPSAAAHVAEGDLRAGGDRSCPAGDGKRSHRTTMAVPRDEVPMAPDLSRTTAGLSA